MFEPDVDQPAIHQHCPDCGRPMRQVSDYPGNEVWCLHCGNRYFAVMGPPGQTAEDKLSGFRVLMLDADGNRRDHQVANLTRQGYLVTPVCHPRQALEAASFRRFDVVVLPARLPEFECGVFIEKLRHLLGLVKFVLLVPPGTPSPGNQSKEIRSEDVVRIEIGDLDDPTLDARLGTLVEQIVDEAISTRDQVARTEPKRRTLVESN